MITSIWVGLLLFFRGTATLARHTQRNEWVWVAAVFALLLCFVSIWLAYAIATKYGLP